MIQSRQAGLFLTFIVFVAILSVGGCCCCSLSGPGTGRFVFLDRHTDVTARVLNGTDPNPQPIPSQKYDFNNDTKKLWLLFPENFYQHYPGLKVFYGDTAWAFGHGDADFGGHSDYSLISQLPYESRDVKVVDVKGNGTVIFKYRNQDIVLMPGESWSGDAYTTTESTMGRNGTVSLNVTRMDTFTNYGLLDASSITA
jgi:hypothetical protein